MLGPSLCPLWAAMATGTDGAAHTPCRSLLALPASAGAPRSHLSARSRTSPQLCPEKQASPLPSTLGSGAGSRCLCGS